MNVSVIDQAANQKKLRVEIPAQKVREQLDKRYRDLAKQVRIKGFRPGKVPQSILKSYYGKTVENEVSSQFIQETFPEALREAGLKPLVEADVDEMHFEDNGTFAYVAVVDVCPPFEVEGYRGLEIQKRSVVVSEEQEQAELDRLRDQHSQLRTLEADRPIEEGDMVLVDFTPSVDGKVFEKGKASDTMIEVGKNRVHPQFDEHLIGHRAGETLEFDLEYAPDAQMKEVAGKTVHFDVSLKELKEKVSPELNDDFAKEVGQFETLQALREEIGNRIRAREEERVEGETRQQIADQMLAKVQFELSAKVIEREVDRMIGLLVHQFESQGLKIDTSRFNTPEIRAGYRAQAERNIRWRLIAEQIASQEHLELTETDLEEVYAEVARVFRMDAETVKQNYADTSIVEETKQSKLQDRIYKLIAEAATYTEASEEETNRSDQE